MFPDELLLMESIAQQQFSAARDSSAVAAPCAGWNLKVEVRVKPGIPIWPRRRITIYLTEDEGWFRWQSTEVDQTLENEDDVTAEIEITPTLVLLEMTSISDIKSRFTGGATCQDDYLMTKTVTAANLRGTLGAELSGTAAPPETV